MGLMLSILVVCVGVIEALSCYEHFQYGIVHYATNVYINARRRSSLFLKYTSGKLKLLPEHSVADYDEDFQEKFQRVRFKRQLTTSLEKLYENSDQISDHFAFVKKSENFKRSSNEGVKKLGEKEKMHIVKSLLEKPRKPEVLRSVSLPELIYTERDIELSNIIDNLVDEPIKEISIEVEDANSEVLMDEFDKLFDEYETSSSNGFVGSFLNDLKEPVSQNTNKLNFLQKPEISESNVIQNIIQKSLNAEIFENFQKDVEPDLISEKELKICLTKVTERSPASSDKFISEKNLLQKSAENYKIGKSASVGFVEIPSIRFNKSLSEDLNISSYFTEKSNVSSRFDSVLEKSLIVDESIFCNKLDDTIFENNMPSPEIIDTSFEEIYNDVCDESLDFTSTYEEIEKRLMSKDDNFNINIKAKSKSRMSFSSVDESNLDLSKEKTLLTNSASWRKTISNNVVLKAIEQLADLIVKDSLNLNKIKSLIFQNLTHLNTCNLKEKFGFTEMSTQTFDTSKQIQLERNTTVEEAHQKLKCNVPVRVMGNFNETIKGEEKNVSRTLLNDMSFNEIQIKISLAAAEEEEKDLTNVRHTVDNGKNIQITEPSVLITESSKMTLEESNTLGSDYIKSCTENLECFKDDTMNIQKFNFPDSPLKSSAYSVSKFPKIEEVIGRNTEEDTEEKTLKDFPESANRETECGKESLCHKFQENEVEQEAVKIKRKTENLFANVNGDADVKSSESRDQQIQEDFLKGGQEKKCERIPVGFEKRTEIQSDATNIYANSDLLSETIKIYPSEGETLLVLDCKKEIKSEENKIISTEQKVEDIGNKNLKDIMKSVIKEKLKLHKKAEESEESVQCERVGTIGLNLAEAEETLSSEKSLAINIKEVNPDFSKINLCTENKGDYSSASDGDIQVESANSTPEAFWLIFSGEYTKAMSKDWHSGHFSCWQCDEALTGQRYVLRDDHPYCIKCYESVFANVCEECNKIIGIDSKDLSYKDKHWHEACFLCNKCRVSLVDKQFGSKADKIYCGNCYDAQFASRCDGCGEIFRAGTKKMEYKTRQWHEKCFCCCVCKTPIGTKSFIPREQEIYCATCYEEKFATRCVKCNKIITSGGVTYKNEPWHRECFTCTNCNTSLAGQRFTSRDEKPYCADCFGELFAKRCTACSKPITGIGGTRFISFEDRHWHNDCFICASCKTSLVGRGFITDGDDIICPECAKQKLM